MVNESMQHLSFAYFPSFCSFSSGEKEFSPKIASVAKMRLGKGGEDGGSKSKIEIEIRKCARRGRDEGGGVCRNSERCRDGKCRG